MGVDISGKNPIIRSQKPQFPSNDVWKKMSEKAKDEFWKLDQEFRENNPGDYFRSNWWGWRPIVMLSEIAAAKSDLDFDFSLWGSNDGGGFDTQEECNQLADALEEIVSDFFDVTETDEVQLCMGSWTTTNGTFIDMEIQQELNRQYPFGTILNTSVVLDDGTLVQSAHSVDKKHLQRFISFLRECGGFEIW